MANHGWSLVARLAPHTISIALLALAPPTARCGVTVVDPAGQPAGALLVSALATAGNGDVILLNPGDYSTVAPNHPVIANKSLVLAPYDPSGPPVTLSRLDVISSNPVTVIVRGLRVVAPFDSTAGTSPVGAIHVNGPVQFVIEDCTVIGSDGGICASCPTQSVGARPAMSALLGFGSSEAVTVVRCDMRGGDGLDVPAGTEIPGVLGSTAGAHGIAFTGFVGVAQIYDSTLVGGMGGDGAKMFVFNAPSDGGSGLFTFGGAIHSAGGTWEGGDEGVDNLAETKPGSGLFSLFGTQSSRHTNFVAGNVNGLGTPVSSVAATMISYPAAPRSLEIAPAPARSHQPLTLTVNGLSGDATVLFLSLASLRHGQPHLQGISTIGALAAPPLFLGVTTDLNGVLSFTSTLPQLPSGVDSLLLHAQITSQNVLDGQLIGGPSTLLWVRDSL